MPSLLQARFTDGTEFKAFTSVELEEDFLAPFDTLRFSVAPTAEERGLYRDKLKCGDVLGFYVDGRPQTFVAIQTVEESFDPGSGTTFGVTCHTASKLLVEADATPELARVLSSDRPLIELMREAVQPFGLGVLANHAQIDALKAKTGKSINGTPSPTVKTGSNQPAAGGESVFAMLNKHASRLGATIRCYPTLASIYLSVPHYDTGPIATVRTHGDGGGPPGDHLFGGVRVTTTHEGQFSECTVYGSTQDEQAATRVNRPVATTTTTEINSKRPPFRASQTIKYKPAVVVDKLATSKALAKSVSKFMLGKTAADAFKLTGTVDGLVSRDGVPWTVDTVVRVYAPEIGINENMWVLERTMTHDLQGQRTALTLIPLGNLVLGEYQAQSS